MYQILPARPVITGLIWGAIASIVLLDWLLPADLFEVARPAILIVGLILWALTWKWVWRPIWRLVGLDRWFPDLNGEYDVELRSNRAPQARRIGGERPSTDETNPTSALRTIRLRARIDLGFYSVGVIMRADETDNHSIERSRTLATTLVRPTDNLPHRLIYVFEQRNQRARINEDDDSVFEGAAVLNILGKEDGGTIKGEYWTNRAWNRGLNTAGTIEFRRRPNEAPARRRWLRWPF